MARQVVDYNGTFESVIRLENRIDDLIGVNRLIRV
jgi:hypothetical protein